MEFYLDCEYNGFGGALISMALVPDSDYRNSLYMINSDYETMKIKKWTKENVIPVLRIVEQPNLRVVEKPVALFHNELYKYFVAECPPASTNSITIIADWPEDIVHFCQSLLSGPGTMISLPMLDLKVAKIDKWKVKAASPDAIEHNAYWDAMALKKYFKQFREIR